MDIPGVSIAEQEGERKPTLREIIEVEFGAAYGDYKQAKRTGDKAGLLKARARMNYLVKRLIGRGGA